MPLRAHRDTLDKVAAAAIVALGAYFVLASFVTRLNREWHIGACCAGPARAAR